MAENCRMCRGSGDCPKCFGSGSPNIFFDTIVKCKRCGGNGKCPRCKGTGIEPGTTASKRPRKSTKTGTRRTAKKSNASGCFLTTACVRARNLPDDCLELETLRAFRDSYLRNRPDGPGLIAEYYAIAPALLAAIDACPDAVGVYHRIYHNTIRPCIRLIQAGRMEEALDLYRGTIARLQVRYLRNSEPVLGSRSRAVTATSP